MYSIPGGSRVYTDNKLLSLGFIGCVEQPLELMALLQLLLRSFLNSADVGLTGIFYYDGLNLGEIIEGPEWAVERRWQVVRETDEFRQLRIIGKKPIFNRNYNDWSMHAKDGVVIGMLYPELIKIVEEFNPSKSIFEKVSLACKTGTFAKAHQPSVFSSKLTFH